MHDCLWNNEKIARFLAQRLLLRIPRWRNFVVWCGLQEVHDPIALWNKLESKTMQTHSISFISKNFKNFQKSTASRTIDHLQLVRISRGERNWRRWEDHGCRLAVWLFSGMLPTCGAGARVMARVLWCLAAVAAGSHCGCWVSQWQGNHEIAEYNV